MAQDSTLVTFEIFMTSNIIWHFLTPLPPTNLFVKRLMYCPHKTLDIYPITAESHLLTDSKLNSVPYASDHLTFNRFEEVMRILFTFVTKPLAPP